MAQGIKERFLGALHGYALGAAWGAALGDRPEVTRLAARAGAGVAPGPATEELRLATAMLDSLALHGKLDATDLAARLGAWLAGGAPRASALTRAAIEELGRGTSPADAARLAMERSGEAAGGNGSLPTSIPIALLHVGELRGVADDAAGASRLTHLDPRCVAACRAVSMALALVVRGQEDEVLERASLMASPSPAVREAIETAPDGDLDAPHAGDEAGSAVALVRTAFVAYCNAPSLEEGLARVLARGGDRPRTAAIAGALLGARFRAAAGPTAKVAGREELLAAGERLWKRIFPGSTGRPG